LPCPQAQPRTEKYLRVVDAGFHGFLAKASVAKSVIRIFNFKFPFWIALTNY
jgi:hypothetical protein